MAPTVSGRQTLIQSYGTLMLHMYHRKVHENITGLHVCRAEFNLLLLLFHMSLHILFPLRVPGAWTQRRLRRIESKLRVKGFEDGVQCMYTFSRATTHSALRCQDRIADILFQYAIMPVYEPSLVTAFILIVVPHFHMQQGLLLKSIIWETFRHAAWFLLAQQTKGKLRLCLHAYVCGN